MSTQPVPLFSPRREAGCVTFPPGVTPNYAQAVPAEVAGRDEGG
jgi:hypothetical protein